ncbi:MAG: 50S ribosomal protein L2 [Phycisphaerae bacterium]|nr:MAG: 50S ribosomal protein L2 [Planctomycetota bacterium]KAB2948544.1 MAG: 50S ribosomal protein L2 [Phycisphaerae bacterium]MBE7458782.1 50S ribosomal protein L2 [Planctomycetia bacterium]MCK6465597.1 50S ribosomal protein L2 [Phycisphaerae bacterium]MCL4719473.1 50S ribosomal protein L2 [Phycisphaerae bacterium]
MALRKYNPTSPGRRAGTVSDFAELTSTESTPVKALTERLTRRGGRNHHGWITSRHRGGGARRLYRRIDFRRNKDGVIGRVERVEYDPNRSANIALIKYDDGELRYILAPMGMKAGMVVESGPTVEPKPGNAMPLKNIPTGMDVHNIEMNPGQGGKLVRSAGGTARFLSREGGWAILVLPSGEMRQVREECRATIGQLGNADHQNVNWGKAGRTRHRGRRPYVRGTAQNPVSHPLGGGEGRSGGGRHPCSKWGKLAKGGRTRPARKPSSKRILRRRRSRRYGQLPNPS